MAVRDDLLDEAFPNIDKYKVCFCLVWDMDLIIHSCIECGTCYAWWCNGVVGDEPGLLHVA